MLEVLAPDAAEYLAAAEAVGLIDRSERGKLAVSGPDAAMFLDSILSNDIGAIAPGHGAQATFLTHKGRMLADVRVLVTDDEVLLDTERVSLQALFDALHQLRIGYRVELHKRTLEVGLLSLIGPLAARPLGQSPAAGEFSHAATDVGGPARVVRTRLGVDVLCGAADIDVVRSSLLAAGAVAIGPATYECVRVEAGIPVYGDELDETAMPQEAGINERAVSYSKGCYIGQETVARLYWKGKPNRILRGLRYTEPVPRGALLRQNEHDVGAVASVVSSPRLGLIGLALVRREAEPGDMLSVTATDAVATVVELPFGDASGAPS